MQITLRELDMTYPNGKKILQGASASLDSLSLIDLLGPNGAGRPTLTKLLATGLLPTSGAIRADGESPTRYGRAYRTRLGCLPQDFGLFGELTVEQSLDYMRALKGLRSDRESIRAVIEAVHLGEKRWVGIRTFSGGQRQRVGIAQTLLDDPALSIFDEPTAGLGPKERIHFRNLLSRLARDRLVLLSAHIIEGVQPMCSRLLVFHQERLRLDGAPEEFIRAAKGHVGTFEARVGGWEDSLHITARVNTTWGVACRTVAGTLPPYVQPAEPTLKDTYLYLILGEGEA